MSVRAMRLRRTALAVVASVVVTAASSVMAAYVANTQSPGNQVSSGSVAIGDSDGTDVPMFAFGVDGSRAPGATVTKCIRVTYTGTLTSRVRLYALNNPAGGENYDLTVERGSGLTGSFPSCTGFTPSASPSAYSGLLNAMPLTYGTGWLGKDADATWATGNTVDYRFRLTVRDETTLDARRDVGYTEGFGFRWEARNV